MLSNERLIRDRNRLRFAWWERKQMCKNYAILQDVWEERNDEQEAKIEQLETMIALHQRGNCEAE